MGEYMITTIDNPYDPFTQYDEWYAYDEQAGYNTCAYLARVADTNEDMLPSVYDTEVERAMDEIIANDPLGIYYKRKENEESPTPRP